MRKVARKVKKYIIPHRHNDHKPYLIRGKGIVGILVLFVVLLGVASFLVTSLNQNSTFLSAVLPSVLVELTNSDRAHHNVGILSVNPLLEQAARMKAEDMARNGYFAHTSPDGKTPWYWLNEVGYKYLGAGENLAVHFTDSKKVEKAWMDSPSHKANILNQGFTEIGIATAEGKFQGKDTVFVVQVFAQPIQDNIFSQIMYRKFETNPYSNTGENVRGAFTATRTEMHVAGYTKPNVLERIISQPLTLLQGIYTLIAFILLITLILMMLSEARKKHRKHIVYTLSLFVIVLLFIFVATPLFFPKIAIAF